jgi:hypothetical protein
MAMVSRSRREWEEIVREYLASGKSAAEFAAERGVNRSTLLWWSSELKRKPVAAAPTFVDVVVSEPAVAEPFVVVIGGRGHRVLVPRGFDEAELRRLVGALC